MCVCARACYVQLPTSFSLLLFSYARSHVGLVLGSGKRRNVVGRGTRLGMEKNLRVDCALDRAKRFNNAMGNSG